MDALELKRVSDLLLFTRVVQSGGVLRCARDVGMRRSTIRRRLSGLEYSLGVSLLERNANRTRLTQSGLRYLKKGLDLLEFATSSFEPDPDTQSTTKTVRVAATVEVFENILNEMLKRFTTEYPQYQVQSEVFGAGDKIRCPDFDVVVQWKPLCLGQQAWRTLKKVEQSTYASLDLIAKDGLPGSPYELRRLPCVGTEEISCGEFWSYSHHGKPVTVKVRYNEVLPSILEARSAAISGAGVCTLPRSVGNQFLQNGQLFELFPDYVPKPLELMICSNANGSNSASATMLRAFLESLDDEVNASRSKNAQSLTKGSKKSTSECQQELPQQPYSGFNNTNRAGQCKAS